MMPHLVRPIEILLVEDSPGDVRLTQEAFKSAKVSNTLHVVDNGEAALRFVRREGEWENSPRPDIILLDLNLPRLSGWEVLDIIKQDKGLRDIPVVILTTSRAEEDIVRSYKQHANCYISKPVDFDSFLAAVRNIEQFWLVLVELPSKENS